MDFSLRDRFVKLFNNPFGGFNYSLMHLSLEQKEPFAGTRMEKIIIRILLYSDGRIKLYQEVNIALLREPQCVHRTERDEAYPQPTHRVKKAHYNTNK